MAMLDPLHPLQSAIIETDKIRKVIPYIDQDTFVIFNVGGTIYDPINTLADPRWLEYAASRIEEKGEGSEIDEGLLQKVAHDINCQIPKRLKESFVAELIDYLQGRSIVVLGMSQRKTALSYVDATGEVRQEELSDLGIHFERTQRYFCLSQHETDIRSTVDFVEGIILTGEEPVGKGLIDFLGQTVRMPKRVVVIDRSRSSLEMIEEQLQSLGISFVGVCYDGEEKDKELDPSLGIIEYFALNNEGKVLTDMDALELKPRDRTLNYELLFDKFIISSCVIMEK